MRLALSATALVATFLAVYAPDVGHGFIKDDFVWIESSRSADIGELLQLFSRNVGFYRPLVSVSFAADYTLWGLKPWGYGITNLGLCVVCAILLFVLAQRLRLSRAAALLASAVWAFNFHAVNMAVLWLSGRTALLATLFSLATALALLRELRLIAGLFCFAAMLSKEEAALLPLLFTAFFFSDQSATRFAARLRRALDRCWPLWASMAAYAVLRLRSGAFSPLSAPSYYQFTFSPALVLRNVAEYADRAATVGAVVAIVLILAVGRQRPRFADHERRTLRFAAIWIGATYALTVFLPIRSSLYALLPSIGVALAVGAMGSWASRISPPRFLRAATALIVLLILLVPAYRSRNVRWVALADVSARVMRTIELAATGKPEAGRIVLVDSRSERFNLDSAFGALFPDAVRLVVGPGWTGQLVLPGDTIPADTSMSFQLTNGELTPSPGSFR